MGRGRLLRKRDDEIEPLNFKRPRTLDGSEGSDDADSAAFASPVKRHFDQRIDPALQDQTAATMTPTSQAQQNNTTSADTILQSEVYNSHEALLTLIEAAGKDTPGMLKSESRDSSEEVEDSVVSGHVRTASTGTMHRSPLAIPGGRYDRAVRFSSISEGKTSSTGSHPRPLHRRKASTVVSPLAHGERPTTSDGDDDGLRRAINSWNKFRFVKAGWFTAREAISFME